MRSPWLPHGAAKKQPFTLTLPQASQAGSDGVTWRLSQATNSTFMPAVAAGHGTGRGKEHGHCDCAVSQGDASQNVRWGFEGEAIAQRVAIVRAVVEWTRFSLRHAQR